ncbi:uncharacterized protein LOC133531172 [Cydia pomonella]|uniref:uncharacterized protein LOC133531172 n=1 Tax=Cydia pomonella TaxID=82600 RepID=UPI002ADDA8E7|nr:uncharacterized protein LOC133531172 [Cydia pomonella]
MRVLLLLCLLAPLGVLCRHLSRGDERVPEFRLRRLHHPYSIYQDARHGRRQNPNFPALLKMLTTIFQETRHERRRNPNFPALLKMLTTNERDFATWLVQNKTALGEFVASTAEAVMNPNHKPAVDPAQSAQALLYEAMKNLSPEPTTSTTVIPPHVISLLAPLAKKAAVEAAHEAMKDDPDRWVAENPAVQAAIDAALDQVIQETLDAAG